MRAWVGAMLLAVACLGACVNVERQSPEKRFFAFEARRHGEARAKQIAGALRIRKFRVSPRYASRGLVYRTGPVSFETDYYNEFLGAPESILTEETRRWLSAAGLYQRVMTTSSAMSARYTMEAVVNELYGDYRKADAYAAVLEIQFFILDNDSANDAIVHKSVHRRRVSLKQKTAESLVQGWNEGLRAILSELETRLAAIRQKSTSPSKSPN